jgi:hypothetical protein
MMTAQGSLKLVGLLVIHAGRFLVMSSLNIEAMGLIVRIGDCSSASWFLKSEGLVLLLAYNDYICEN